MQIEKKSYIVNNQIWLNKLYFQISNSKDKQCLTIDTREANELGPGKFRTHTDNNEEQTCFFNRKNDTHIFSFLAKRVPNEQIIFKTNIDFERNKSLEISLENSVLKNESSGDIQSASRENFRRRYFDNARRPETSGFTPERNFSHSQPMPEDDEMTETVEEKAIIQEIDQQVPEKNQNLSEMIKLLIDIG